MMSDVCKHCVNAPCLEVCPTGAIVRTEFDTVYINDPACNGCRDCISACPFGVIHMSEDKRIAQKCTFCYDRLKNGLTPACAQACPTQSIRFGPIDRTEKEGGDARRSVARHGRDAGAASTAPTTKSWVVSTPSTCWWTSRKFMDCPPTPSCRAEACRVLRSGASSRRS